MRGPNVQTRRRILDVALELFRSQGYDRTSLREISERLGFSKAALYYHFNAKEDILVALAGDLLDELERIIEAALANPDRSLAARSDVLNRLFDLILSHRATAELLLFEHPPLHDTDLGERVRRVLPQALEALLPAAPTVEDRIRAAAALGIVKSALDNLDYLADGSCPGLREIVMKLATSALDRQAS